MLKGIVFDLDGTLADSLTVTFEAFNHVFNVHGAPILTPKEIMRYFGTGEREILAAVIGEKASYPGYETFCRYTSEAMTRIPFHSGALDLIERLKSEGVPMAIVTGRSWTTTETILKHHRVLDRFITVVAHDHVSLPKPSPEGIQLALQRMSLSGEQIMYVGDSHMDIQAAKAARAQSVAALWDPLASREVLEKQEPHHYAESPAQVWDAFKQALSAS
jgi:pyrophosphatase PpaX